MEKGDEFYEASYLEYQQKYWESMEENIGSHHSGVEEKLGKEQQ